MSLGSSTPTVQVDTVKDGALVAKGGSIAYTVSATDADRSRDIEVEVTLTAADGTVVTLVQRGAAAVNQEQSISLPASVVAGVYRLDVVVTTGGEVTLKKTSTVFVAGEGWKILGISTFPPLIATRASVMLKADLQVPPGSDPWLRWSWKGKVLDKGLLSKGFDQVLWVAPSDEGVYTITLEVFPTAPAVGSDFAFASSLQLATSIFVTNGTAQGKGDLGPASSYLSVLHLQANLSDAGTGAAANGLVTATPVGQPDIVSLDDGFGYRLDGSTGIQLGWLPLPADNGALLPFTLSLGITPDDPAAGGTLVAAASADKSVSLVVTLAPGTGAPHAVLTAAGKAPFEIPWTGTGLAAHTRTALSLSLTPLGSTVLAQWFLDGIQQSSAVASLGSTVLAQWFLDGIQQSSAVASLSVTGVRQKGALTIGGESGFKGIVDEMGVFVVDATGRPSTDPDQFARAMADTWGTRLVFADGFDAAALSSSLTTEGTIRVSAGTVTLAAGSALGLPPVKRESTPLTVTASLAEDSAGSAAVRAQWEGSGSAVGQLALGASDGSFVVHVGADGQSLVVGSGAAARTLALNPPADPGVRLLLSIVNPADARSAIALTQVVATQDEQE